MWCMSTFLCIGRSLVLSPHVDNCACVCFLQAETKRTVEEESSLERKLHRNLISILLTEHTLFDNLICMYV
jgi:hypothetical protein